jgi:predicted Zn-dependent protease
MKLHLLVVAALLSMAPAAQSSKAQREAADAAAAYERAMTLVRQGAFEEAEKEFRTAEKKTDEKNLDYVIAAAENYIELHKPDEARKRFERIYKKDPSNTRALVGLASAYEEAQNHRDALRMWQRYAAMDLPPDERKEAEATLREARTLFLERYDATEKLAGAGAAAAPTDREREWGAAVARNLAATGVALVSDAGVTAYVEGLCRTLGSHAKGFAAPDRVLVLDSADVRAFAAPGYFFVFRGMLDAVSSESALAGVLAHHMGHAAAGHVTRALSWQAAAGDAVNEPQYTRDQEKQADRVAAHVAFDSGFDPGAAGRLLEAHESLPYSSRKPWEAMTRSHPIWKDRIAALAEHVTLFPDRAAKTASPAFTRMKGRLAQLPPPPAPIATPASIPPSAPDPAPGKGGSTKLPRELPPWAQAPSAPGSGLPYTLDNAPFAGQIPQGWTARTTEAGTIVFEGAKGTPAYEATVELQVAPKSQFPGLTLDDMAGRVAQNLRKNERAEVHDPVTDRTGDGRPVRRIASYYSLKDGSGRLVPVRSVSGVVDYPGWFAVVSYFAPTGSFEQFLKEVDFIGDHLRYTGK